VRNNTSNLKKLNPRHIKFCIEYIKDSDGGAAARRAGFAESSARVVGCNLLKDPLIQAELEKRCEKVANRLELSAASVLEGIQRIIARCEQAEPVFDKEGNPTGEYIFDAKACLKGYELLGKHLKLFTEKRELSFPSLENATNEQLSQIAASLGLPSTNLTAGGTA
jgi:phage terminase small subunit